jgi:hypothetical protein
VRTSEDRRVRSAGRCVTIAERWADRGSDCANRAKSSPLRWREARRWRAERLQAITGRDSRCPDRRNDGQVRFTTSFATHSATERDAWSSAR